MLGRGEGAERWGVRSAPPGWRRRPSRATNSAPIGRPSDARRSDWSLSSARGSVAPSECHKLEGVKASCRPGVGSPQASQSNGCAPAPLVPLLSFSYAAARCSLVAGLSRLHAVGSRGAVSPGCRRRVQACRLFNSRTCARTFKPAGKTALSRNAALADDIMAWASERGLLALNKSVMASA
eukprot:scaffold4648_cov295-Prasinococcus_capsulatus_cf.AAC.4